MKRITTISIITATLTLAACGGGQSPTDAQTSGITASGADAPVAAASAPAPVAALSAPAAADTVQVTKADLQAMLDAARKDTAEQILAAQQVKEEADAKAATEKRIQRAERAAAQARAEVKQAKAEAAQPVYQTVTRRVCEQNPSPQLERSPMGMLAGAALGALAGNQVGGGQGRTLATIAGAAGGAYAGDAMANSGKPGTVEVCHDVTEQVRVK